MIQHFILSGAYIVSRIRVTKGAHTALLDLEELDDKHLAKIKRCYAEIASDSRAAMKKGEKDTGTPFVHLDK